MLEEENRMVNIKKIENEGIIMAMTMSKTIITYLLNLFF